jgi:glycosyltransferase involved in cell wall biosynthesis
MIVDAIIPALDEAANIERVVHSLGPYGLRRVVVADNGSTDRTAAAARAAGATVVSEPRRGYGAACLAGLAYLRTDPPGAVLFLDGDGADDVARVPALLTPLRADEADLVVGSRTLGRAEQGAITPVQRFGNVLSSALVSAFFGVRFTDLGPFRAITWPGLTLLDMADRDFGWTVEMQAKAARRGLRCLEVPVDARARRAGESKVSGTIKGSVKAGAKILYTIGREAVR